MIRGRVDFQRQALIPLQVADANGQFQRIEAILDTGYNGNLTLPQYMVEGLGLEADFLSNVTLGNNIQTRLPTWSGYILWHEQLRHIQGLMAEGVPLIGMRLLADSEVTIQVRSGGAVLIEEMA